ncbi:hypothetical protein [Priestia megaterium]|uniref:hypothetical protein n=1 Tax=Priestia megaterium TaxID=1404 RepID=UPI002E1D9A42|nr:hypothetical protein [Priestia megaterium]
MFRDKDNATDNRDWLVDVPQGLWMYLEDMGYFKDDVVIEQVIAYCKSGIKRIDANADERIHMANENHKEALMEFYNGCKSFLEKYDNE